MQLWRISRHKLLDGVGGIVADGRWHARGRPIVYCSTHPASALLEWIVHLELVSEQIPTTIPYITVDVPDDVRSDRVPVSSLPATWRTNVSGTQEIGIQWIASARSALLYVPSAVVPETENVLINPLHTDAARIHVGSIRDEPFDSRLFSG
ncbi:MAG: RES family NAD+ phosphorylase [Candidatus Baltobacteraceae bacterium]